MMMRRLRKFLQLPATRKLFLLKAVLWLAAVRAALSLIAFGTLRRLLSSFANLGNTRSIPPRSEIGGIVWALGTAGRAFPSIGSCLSQALAGYAWLGSRG